MNRIGFKVGNPNSENAKAVTAEKPIAASIAFLLVCLLLGKFRILFGIAMPVIAVNLNDKLAILNQKVTDQVVNNCLWYVADTERVQKVGHCQFWLTDKFTTACVVLVKYSIVTLNGAKATVALFNSIFGSVKFLATFLTSAVLASASSFVSTFGRAKAFTGVISRLEGLTTSLTRARFTTRSDTFALAGTINTLPCFQFRCDDPKAGLANGTSSVSTTSPFWHPSGLVSTLCSALYGTKPLYFLLIAAHKWLTAKFTDGLAGFVWHHEPSFI